MKIDPSSSKPLKKNDFWDLDDDETTETPLTEEVEIPQEREEPTPEPAPEQPEPEPLQQTPEPEPVPVAESEQTGKKKEPNSLLEKICLSLVLAIFVGAAIWGLSTYLNDAPQAEALTFNQDYPLQGNSVTITNVETWWRKPIREGDNIDSDVIITAELIPCAQITISDANTEEIRVTFRNSELQLVGDIINIPVSNGKFVETNSTEIEINATAGFSDEAYIHSYANQDIEPWALSIFEKESDNDGEPLVKARISSITLDN